ncbi:hypothetical protein DH2020_020561 [Rehmannia glutinosa]|uniref:HSF-type DNA-binding domain-containing protein n=1 Tax=Rehmannia glutinosa TaxID=99300 RepID=A0ABR0WGZ9_REHGL
MVKSVENGTSLPPFLVKCYEMVNDDSTNELISWSESNDSFIIWDESRFSSQLLPKYFKHSNFSSFVRQLNIYGFRKIDTDHWQFANEAFIKGQKHLLKNISRRKQPQNPVQKKSPQHKDTEPTQQSEEDKAIALWKEVEILKTHKNALTQELKKLHQHQQTSKSKMLLLACGETGKTKLSEVTDDCEPTPSDGVIVRYEPPKDGYPVPASTTEASKSDDLMELDFSSDEIRDLFMDIDLLLGPIDEKLLPLENRGQFVLPDTPENDTMLEQLLLSYPSTENEQHAECEADKSDDSTDDFDEYQNHITEDTNFQSPIDTSEKVQVLTE